MTTSNHQTIEYGAVAEVAISDDQEPFVHFAISCSAMKYHSEMIG